MKKSLHFRPRRAIARPSESAFTLAEILVVLVIIAIIASFAMPAMNSVLKGSKMTLAGDQVVRDLNLARQVAIKDNAPVEFRFYRVSDPEQPGAEEEYRAYQAVRKLYDPRDSDKFEIETVTDVHDLPEAVIFADSREYSSLIASNELIDDTVETGIGEASRVEGEEYKSFVFMTDGSVNLPDTGGDSQGLWYFTIKKETDGDSALREFVTIQLDPATGHVRRYDK